MDKIFDTFKTIRYRPLNPKSYENMVNKIPSETEVILVYGIGKDGSCSKITIIQSSIGKMKSKFCLTTIKNKRKEWLDQLITEMGLVRVELSCGRFRDKTGFHSALMAA